MCVSVCVQCARAIVRTCTRVRARDRVRSSHPFSRVIMLCGDQFSRSVRVRETVHRSAYTTLLLLLRTHVYTIYDDVVYYIHACIRTHLCLAMDDGRNTTRESCECVSEHIILCIIIFRVYVDIRTRAGVFAATINACTFRPHSVRAQLYY